MPLVARPPQVISLDEVTSSSKKGETMSDTLKTISEYTDVIAMRHPVEGSVGAAAQHASRPVINAGRALCVCDVRCVVSGVL